MGHRALAALAAAAALATAAGCGGSEPSAVGFEPEAIARDLPLLARS